MTSDRSPVVLRARDGATVTLETFPAVLGRGTPAAEADETTYDMSNLDTANKVSRRHARLWWESGQLMVADLGSSNGTRLDGSVLAKGASVVAANGARLELGPLSLGVEFATTDTGATVVEAIPNGAPKLSAEDRAATLEMIRGDNAQRMVDRVAKRGQEANAKGEIFDEFFALLTDPAVDGGDVAVGEVTRVRRLGVWTKIGPVVTGEAFAALWQQIAQRTGAEGAAGRGPISVILDGVTAVTAYLPPTAAVARLHVERLVGPLSLDRLCDGNPEASVALLQAIGTRQGILVWGEDRHALAQTSDALVSAVNDGGRVVVVERRAELPVRTHVTRLISGNFGGKAVSQGLAAGPGTLVLCGADASTLKALDERVTPGSVRLIVSQLSTAEPAAHPLLPVRVRIRRAPDGIARVEAISGV